MLVLDGCRGVVVVVSHILYGFKLVVDRVDGSVLKLTRLQHVHSHVHVRVHVACACACTTSRYTYCTT